LSKSALKPLKIQVPDQFTNRDESVPQTIQSR
jgi:hypothetical protein